MEKQETINSSKANISYPQLPPLFHELYESIQSYAMPKGYKQQDVSVLRGAKDDTHRFLSVIIRTTGKRIFMLEQTLTCLLAQQNSDFNVIIVMHNPESELEMDNVIDLVESFPSSLTDKLTILEVNGGRRGVPMNVGICESKSKYVAFLDDDDLVTRAWVSSFHETAISNPNKICRNRCVDRAIQKRNDNDFAPVLTLSNWIVSRSDKFNFIENLERNCAPLHSYAIPKQMIVDFDTYVDVSLNVAEDWEYFMRNAALLGVADHNSTTAIYNRWANNESSSHLHEEEEWVKAHQDTIERFKSRSLAIPGKEVGGLFSVFGILYQMRDLVEFLVKADGFGEIHERLNKLNRFEAYARIEKSRGVLLADAGIKVLFRRLASRIKYKSISIIKRNLGKLKK